MIRTWLASSPWRSQYFVNAAHLLAVPHTHWVMVILILAVGVVAAIVSLMAYAPVKGADAFDYMLHAAFLDGADLPPSLASFQPVYPLLLYVFDHKLMNLYMLVAVQQFFSLTQGLLYYFALRRFSVVIAFVIGLIVALDMQSRVAFNFLSTEPVYMILLALMFYLLMRQISDSSERYQLAGDIGLAVTVTLLAFTRSVGQPLIIPVLLVFALKTHNWRRTVVVVIAFLVAYASFTIAYRTVFPQVTIFGGDNNNNMIAQPLLRSGLLQTANGPFSDTLIEIQTACADIKSFSQLIRCMSDQLPNGRSDLLNLLRGAYGEMVRAHPLAYGQGMLNEFTAFLSMTGQQLPSNAPSPASMQCQNLETLIEQTYTSYREGDVLLASQPINDEALYTALHNIIYKLCPPLPEVTGAKAVVDYIALRYRSLSRPDPWIWYIALGLCILILPFARRLWPVALSAFLILSTHAALSAAVFNVQARYTMVTNPFKAILLVLLLYIIGRGLTQGIDYWLAKRQTELAQETKG